MLAQKINFYAELSAFQNTSSQLNEFTSNSQLIEFLEQSIDLFGIEGLLEVNEYKGATSYAHSHFLTFHFQPIQRPYCALVGLEAFLLFVYQFEFFEEASQPGIQYSFHTFFDIAGDCYRSIL